MPYKNREVQKAYVNEWYAIMLLTDNRDVSRAGIEDRSDVKRRKIKRYLHHQSDATLPQAQETE